MAANLRRIIESILKNSAVWISGPYGSGKTTILYKIKNYYESKNYDVRFCYVEPSDTPANLFYKISSRREQNFERFLNQLLEKITEKHKEGLVIIIDELENAFNVMDDKNMNQISQFIQNLTEFIFKNNSLENKSVFLIISSQELFFKDNYLMRILNKLNKIHIS